MSLLYTYTHRHAAGFCLLTTLMLLTACGGGAQKLQAAQMPDSGSFSGVWFSPQYGRIDMHQTGTAVVGEYTKDERSGKIQGTVTGNLMRFTWEERRALVANRPTVTRGRGYFHYFIDGPNQEHRLQGEWGIDDQHTGGGPWTAVKSTKLKPQMSQGTVGAERPASGGFDSSYEGDADDDLLDL